MEIIHIVAIIGAVTGLIGCFSGLYATYRLWQDKPKINIHIDAAYHYCLLEGGPGEQKPLIGAKQESGCEVRLHIRNNGSRPTTIEDFQAEFEIPKDSIGYSYYGLIYGPCEKTLKRGFKLPLRLDPGSSQYIHCKEEILGLVVTAPIATGRVRIRDSSGNTIIKEFKSHHSFFEEEDTQTQ